MLPTSIFKETFNLVPRVGYLQSYQAPLPKEPARLAHFQHLKNNDKCPTNVSGLGVNGTRSIYKTHILQTFSRLLDCAEENAKTELKRTIFVGLGRDSPVSRLWNIDSASSPRIFEQRKPKKRLLAASCLNTFSIESLTQDPVDRVHVQHYTGRNIFLGIKTILYEYFPDYCKKKNNNNTLPRFHFLRHPYIASHVYWACLQQSLRILYGLWFNSNFSLSKTFQSIWYNLWETALSDFCGGELATVLNFEVMMYPINEQNTKKSLFSCQNTTALCIFTQMILIHCIYVANINRELGDKYWTATELSYVTRMIYLEESRMASFKHDRISRITITKTFAITVIQVYCGSR